MPNVPNASIHLATSEGPARHRSDQGTVAPLPAAQRKERQVANAEKQAEIDAAVAKWAASTMATASELAERFGKKDRYFLDLFFHGGARMLVARPNGNAWCAWTSELAERENDGSSSKIDLIELQGEHRHEYDELSKEDKAALLEKHLVKKKTNVQTARVTARSRVQDVAVVTRSMKQLLHGLDARVGIQAFFCIVSSSSTFSMEPQWFFTSQELETYMGVTLRKRWDTAEVGRLIELFAVSGSSTMSALRTAPEKVRFLKGHIRDSINSGLVEITKNPKAIMQYLNYERDIVLRYGVVLEGWTHTTWANPSDLSNSLPPLQALYDALQSGRCKFILLSKEVLGAREAEYQKKLATGDITDRTRKERSDKGKKRKNAGDGAKAAGPQRVVKVVGGQRMVLLDGSWRAEVSSDSSSDDEEPIPRQKRPRAVHKSASIIDSDEDEQ